MKTAVIVFCFIQECTSRMDGGSRAGLASGGDVQAELNSLGPGEMFSMGPAGKSAAQLPQ